MLVCSFIHVHLWVYMHVRVCMGLCVLVRVCKREKNRERERGGERKLIREKDYTGTVSFRKYFINLDRLR